MPNSYDKAAVAFTYRLTEEKRKKLYHVLEDLYGGEVCMTSATTASFFLLHEDYKFAYEYLINEYGINIELWFTVEDPWLARKISDKKGKANRIERLMIGLANSSSLNEVGDFKEFAADIKARDRAEYGFAAAKFIIAKGGTLTAEELDYLKQINSI